jgi:Isopenicillin N synthase and related dioxygenases
MTAVPRIDVAPLIDGRDVDRVAEEIDRACREVGFFSIVNHGVDPALCLRLDTLTREFFARPVEAKQRVAMIHGGTAWRGWFPLHGELTSGTPDHKEGYYFGRELAPEDPRVQSGVPLHGPNLWPEEPHELRSVLTEYLHALESLGQHLARAFSIALGLGPQTLHDSWFRDPVILLRLFRYPPAAADSPPKGVGEHTDYGFLTMLWQDGSGGLEVRTDQGWVEVPPDPEAFVCNIGDMLDRLTAGRYRSTAHRVQSPRTRDRIAIPFFFDPDWDARIGALPLTGAPPADDAGRRWDNASVHAFEGTYGEYLLGKVAKVFPDLGAAVLAPNAAS